MIHSRVAHIDDIETIQKIAYETWPHTFGEILEAKQIEYMLEWMYNHKTLAKQIQRPQAEFFLAYWDTDPIGFASVEAEGKEAKLHKLYVLPSKQYRGVGSHLLYQVEEKVRDWDCHSIYLQVNRHNAGAVSFYKTKGFTIREEKDIDIGQGYWMNDYFMVKSIR